MLLSQHRVQELVEMVGRANGIVLMAWPTEDRDAKATVATLLSAIKPKQQVIVAESYGGTDEPVDDIVRSLVGVEVDPHRPPARQGPAH